MTEKQFTLAYENEDWWAVKNGEITLWKEEVVDLMNKMHDKNKQLEKDNEWLKERNEGLAEEITAVTMIIINYDTTNKYKHPSEALAEIKKAIGLVMIQ